MWIETLKSCPFSEIVRLARESSKIVAEKGDIILYRSEKKGETAKAFDALARGIACLAFAPGGVKFMGTKFQANHPDMEYQDGNHHA